MQRKRRFKNSRVIAVTGGIGSGQSTVCAILKEYGCKIIDVDRKAKQIIAKDKFLQKELQAAFGTNIFYRSGRLNRHQLAGIAFRDEEKTHQLNKLVHPRMVAEIVEEMEEARFSQRYPLIVIDAALIFEISIEQMFDSIIVVYASLKNRIERIKIRDKLSEEDIRARVSRQIPLEEKRKWADFEIDNNGSVDDLRIQTKKIFDKLVDQIPVERYPK
jgi:dephospho-CoA kinase